MTNNRDYIDSETTDIGSEAAGPIGSALLTEDADLRSSYLANSEKRRIAMAFRALRRWADLSQAEVAERSGLSQSHISKVESATGPVPTTDTMRRYAAACDARVRIVLEQPTTSEEVFEDQYVISSAVA